MSRVMITVLLLLPVTLTAQAPFPGGVYINGGWVPCSHPIAIQAGVGCVPGAPVAQPPAPPPATSTWQVGQVYKHIYGWEIKVIATGQLFSGKVVFIAEILAGQPFGGVGAGGLVPLPLDSPGWSRIELWR